MGRAGCYLALSSFVLTLFSCANAPQNPVSTSPSVSFSSASMGLSSESTFESLESDFSTSSDEVEVYHVIFCNDDGTILFETDVESGQEAVYKGETPVKEEDAECSYSFVGWDKDVTSVTSDSVFTAVYEAIPKIPWSSIEWF